MSILTGKIVQFIVIYFIIFLMFLRSRISLLLGSVKLIKELLKIIISIKKICIIGYICISLCDILFFEVKNIIDAIKVRLVKLEGVIHFSWDFSYLVLGTIVISLRSIHFLFELVHVQVLD